MLIRKAVKTEVSKIVTLIRKSLGESLVKKSEEIWQYKHIDNPFGESYVLVAEENQELIGVRAFMQWRWQIQDALWVSYRAVDTATHPSHQGKGIFTKLTTQALKDVQEISEAFVFNTPNDKSRPGYLKMGWQSVGKIKVALIPSWFYFFYLLKKNGFTKNTISDNQLKEICNVHNSQLESKKVLFTPKSVAYLTWRYENNPMQRYKIVSSSNWYLAMYVKKHRFYNELRVVETIGGITKAQKRQMKHVIVKFALQNNCFLITMSNPEMFKLKLYGSFGPMLTFKSLTDSDDFVNKALDIEHWQYALGDLELF